MFRVVKNTEKSTYMHYDHCFPKKPQIHLTQAQLKQQTANDSESRLYKHDWAVHGSFLITKTNSRAQAAGASLKRIGVSN